MNNHTWIWRIIVGGLIAIILGAMGWNFTATANIPKEYATKKEHQSMEEELHTWQYKIDGKLDEIMRLIIELHKE